MGKYAKIFIIAIFLIFSFSMVLIDGVEAEKYNMSYLYFGLGTQYVDNTMDSLDMVAPSYFDLILNKETGELEFVEKVDQEFVNEMHKREVKVVPFLSNHWNREAGRKTLENKEEIVKLIVDAVEEYDLDGINVDIENLNHEDRDSYTDFVRILRQELPESKEVSVAVAAKTYDAKTGWHASYDYKELVKYSDYLMLMTYDESWYGSNPGPVSSIGFVEKAINYALQEVPAEKIVLGIPFYGRYWKIDSNEIGGRGISLNKIEELNNQFSGTEYFDQNSKSSYSIINIPASTHSDSLPKLGNRTLKQGTYIIWYENDQSIKLKLKLVEKYNLKGTGSWSLSQAPKETWDYYKQWLNGEHYFLDAEKHWAEQDISAIQEKGWMIGTSDDYFSPNSTLTRAQGAVVLVRALGLSQDNEQNNTLKFEDVSDNFWGKKEIEIAYKNGIVKGIGEGKFAPDDPLTREQMAAMLSRVFKYNQTSDSEGSINSYLDLNSDDWAYDDIMILSELNIFTGYEDGNFYPKKSVTRAETAALMNRIIPDIDRIANLY